MSLFSSLRVWWRSLCSFDVFRVIRDTGHSPHWSYAAGMSRLSCSSCILASRIGLRRAAKLRADLYRTYATLERRIGHEHFTELMDGLCERARFIEDYPSKEDLQDKFAIRYRISPIPDTDHFIAQLASDDTERMQRGTHATSRNSSTVRWATSTAASAKPSSASPSGWGRTTAASRWYSATR